MEIFSIFGLLWNEVIIRPMLNTLMVLYVLCFSQMGVAIIVFTALVRILTIPLTVRQVRQMRAMTGLQPRVREIQQRHVGDRQRISQETMRLYRESGVSPVGCLGPLIVQMPILIGLFRVLIQTLFNNPEDLVSLSGKLYTWITFVPIHAAAPVNSTFLWLDLSQPDPSPIVMPILVAVSTWVQQKMTQMPSPDPRQQSSQTMMLWMMPIFLGAFSLGWPSGLPLYWVVSNILGISIQYFITGWGPLFPLFPKRGGEPDAVAPSTFVPIHAAAPVNSTFLWLDLSQPDPSPIVMPILVAVSTWVQQKMTQMPSPDPRQQSSQTMMLWMMPIFLGAFSLGWPSGLPLYWVVSNILGISIQYFITGWGPLFPLFPKRGGEPDAVAPSSPAPAPQENEPDGSNNSNRTDRRRSRRAGARSARRRPQRGRGRNTK